MPGTEDNKPLEDGALDLDLPSTDDKPEVDAEIDDELDDEDDKPAEAAPVDDQPAANQVQTDEADAEVAKLEKSIALAKERYGDDDPLVQAFQVNLSVAKSQAAKIKEMTPIVQDRESEKRWTNLEKKAGVDKAPAHVKDKLSREALQKKLQEYHVAVGADPDYVGDDDAIKAIATDRLKAYIRRIKATPKPANVPSNNDNARAQGREHRTGSGGRLTPPGGAAGNRAPSKDVSPEDEFAQSIAKAGNRFDPSQD